MANLHAMAGNPKKLSFCFFPLFDAINNTHIVTPLSSGGAKQIEFNKLHLLMLWFRLSFTFAASATGGQQVLANYVSKSQT